MVRVEEKRWTHKKGGVDGEVVKLDYQEGSGDRKVIGWDWKESDKDGVQEELYRW